MIPWLKRLLWDESAFTRYARGLLLGGSAAWMAWQINGYLDTEMVLGAMGLGLGGLMGAGDRHAEES